MTEQESSPGVPAPGHAITIACIACVLVVCILHGCNPDAVFPSDNPDFGFHIAVVNRLLVEGMFPLPYRGIIASHAFVALVCRTLDVSIPRAMLFVADASFLLLLAALLLAARRADRHSVPWVAATVMLVTAPLLMSLYTSGFFGQATSLGPYALAMFFILGSFAQPPRKRALLAGAIVGIGALFYPDSAIWLLPCALFPGIQNLRKPLLLAPLVASVGVSGVLLSRQLELLGYTGAVLKDWSTQMALLVALVAGIAIFARPKNLSPGTKSVAQAIVAVFAVYATVCIGMSSLSVLKFGAINYYPKKNYYALALFLPWLVIVLASTRNGRRVTALALALFGIVSMIPKTWLYYPVLYPRWLRPTAAFDSKDADCAQQVHDAAHVNECDAVLVLPPSQTLAGDQPWERTQRVVAYNSYVGHYPIDRDFPELLDGYHVSAIAESVRRNAGKSLPSLYESLHGLDHYDCLALDASMPVADAPRLFTCPVAGADRTTLILYRVRPRSQS